MAVESAARPTVSRMDRVPPHSEDAERGVLGSILLDAVHVLDLAVERQISPESFYVPRHALIFEAMLDMSRSGLPIDVLTLAERLRSAGRLDEGGGPAFLDGLIDSTPTAAHAEYYIDIVRQKDILRSIIACSRGAERECYESDDTADGILSRTEQAFLNITERQHGSVMAWPEAVQGTMEHVEKILTSGKGITGISTGFANLDVKLHGMRSGEMIVLAARPSMGKTSLAMNIAENVALGVRDPDGHGHNVGVFSLEMSQEALVLRMLCSHAGVKSFDLTRGFITKQSHAQLARSASVLKKAGIFVDDTGGLDVMELRARARRMKRKQDVALIVIDYLQLLHSRDRAREGRQNEIAHVSGNLKAMAKELKVPVLVLSQLSRAPEQRDKSGKPKLSDLRDSGAIEQDADVVCMLRRPCKYPEDEEAGDDRLAVVDVAKQRNGPTGEVRLNFEDEFTRFRDREHGVDGAEMGPEYVEEAGP
jgi:replicative DNA helicase